MSMNIRVLIIVFLFCIIKPSSAQIDTIILNMQFNYIEYSGKIYKGKRIGTWHQYNQNKDILKEIMYFDNNTFECKKYHANFSKITGEASQYVSSIYSGYIDSAGNEISHGSYTTFYPSGKKMAESNYLNGKINGQYITFDKNEDTIMNCLYKNGMLNGYYKEYFQKSKVKISGEYSKGKKNGLWIEFYNNGTTKEKGNYLPVFYTLQYKDFIQFRFIVFDQNNKIIDTLNYTSQIKETINWLKQVTGVKMPYKMHLKEGIWKYWNEKGVLIKKEKYKKGKLIN